MDAHERNKQVLADIDATLAAPPPTIEESIRHAEDVGVYTHEEAELYINAYRKAFHKFDQ